MRLLLAVVLATCGLAIAPGAGWPARAVPGDCPPICDAIPDSAWIAPTSIPLYPVYRWPGLAGLAVTAPSPRFGFEALCGSPPVADDPRAYAVAARSVVLHPAGQWNLLVQVMHWRGDTATGGPTALDTLETARSTAARLPIDGRRDLAVDHHRRAAAHRRGDQRRGPIRSCTSTCWPTPTAAPSSNWPCGRHCRRRSTGPRWPTRRSSTRWRPRCATRTSGRAGEAVPALPPVE